MIPQIQTIVHPVSQHEHPAALCGAITPLFTPERLDGKIDFDGIEALTDYVCDKSSVSAIVIRSTEGSIWAYKEQEVYDAIGCVLAVAKGRKPVIAGTAGIWDGDIKNKPRPAVYFRQAIKFSEWALTRGAAAVLQAVPAFLPGGHDYTPQDRILQFFKDLAKSLHGPMIICHQAGIPVSAQLTPSQLAELSKIDNYLGLIHYTRDASLLSELVRLCDPRFCVVSGHESVAIPAFMSGVSSSAGALSTLLPELVSGAWISLEEPDLPLVWKAQSDLLRLRDALHPYALPEIGCAILSKMGVKMAGRPRAGKRAPLNVDLDRAIREFARVRAAYM